MATPGKRLASSDTSCAGDGATACWPRAISTVLTPIWPPDRTIRWRTPEPAPLSSTAMTRPADGGNEASAAEAGVAQAPARASMTAPASAGRRIDVTRLRPLLRARPLNGISTSNSINDRPENSGPATISHAQPERTAKGWSGWAHVGEPPLPSRPGPTRFPNTKWYLLCYDPEKIHPDGTTHFQSLARSLEATNSMHATYLWPDWSASGGSARRGAPEAAIGHRAAVQRLLWRPSTKREAPLPGSGGQRRPFWPWRETYALAHLAPGPRCARADIRVASPWRSGELASPDAPFSLARRIFLKSVARLSGEGP